MVFGGFVEMETVTVGRYSGKVAPVYSVMRNLNSESASGDLYISSPTPASVNRAYHEIWEPVKKGGPTAISWGSDRGLDLEAGVARRQTVSVNAATGLPVVRAHVLDQHLIPCTLPLAAQRQG